MSELDINSTREEYEGLDFFRPADGVFNGIVIIPMDCLHNSGFRCMKFALMHHSKVVGCVGGGSDVVHLNGIGGYGKRKEFWLRDVVKSVDWAIDCLPNGLIRLFCSHELEIDNLLLSDFNLYVKEG